MFIPNGGQDDYQRVDRNFFVRIQIKSYNTSGLKRFFLLGSKLNTFDSFSHFLLLSLNSAQYYPISFLSFLSLPFVPFLYFFPLFSLPFRFPCRPS